MTEPSTPNAEDSMEGYVGPGRRKLPDSRESKTVRFEIEGMDGYVTAGMYEDGTLGEVFVKDVGKAGSTVQGLLDAWATTFSIALQYGAEFDMLARKLHHMNFEPKGTTDHPDIPKCRSLIDFIIRWLTLHFGNDELKHDLNGGMTR